MQKIRNRRYCTEMETRVIIRKLTDVIGYLHDHGVVHRDIKVQQSRLNLARKHSSCYTR